MVEEIKVPKKEWLSMKATIKKLQSGAKKMQAATKGPSAEGFKVGGGQLDFMEEGAALYDLRKESFAKTGLLLDELTGPKGFISKFAKLSESGVSIFGSIKPTLQAFEDLAGASRSFAMNQTEVQSSMGQTLAVFKELGVDVQDFSAILDSARLGFGMTGAEAEKLARSVGNIGLATGVGMGEATKNFRSAQASMAYSSKKLMENFKQLQFTAATTGVSFDKLTGAFGDSMDTFEGSAGKAGSLNAILGRSVFNSIDLLGKTEGERVSTIIKGIRKSTDVQALSKNKFQLKAVAEGLGLTPDETRKLLTGQSSVDAVLAGKAPKDPREIAISKMVELMRDGTNPELSKFIDILKKGRTELVNVGAELNAAQRTLIQGALTTAFDSTAVTPAEIFTKFEGVIESMKGISIEGLKEMRKEVTDFAIKLTAADKNERAGLISGFMTDTVGKHVKRRGEDGNVRYTASRTASRAAGAKVLKTETQANLAAGADSAKAGIAQAINVVLDGILTLKIGDTDFSAYVEKIVKGVTATK